MATHCHDILHVVVHLFAHHRVYNSLFTAKALDPSRSSAWLQRAFAPGRWYHADSILLALTSGSLLW